jgi:fucose permease
MTDSARCLHGVTQLQILFCNFQVFLIMVTFFVCTCLWVFIEPILSLHLVENFQVTDWQVPMFFFIFSLGYLMASLTMYWTKVSEIRS